MTFSFAHIAEAVRLGGTISPNDVLALRRWAWRDGGVSPAEADALFELNDLVADASREWVDFFVEALTEYLVNQQDPRGYVDDRAAAWLTARIDRDGRLDTLAELELIVKILERALNAPALLKHYGLRQIEQTVLTGEGATRRGDLIRPGVVDEAEVALLRRLLFAPGGDGAILVSREEAEMLWRLKDATLGRSNAPGWKTLFVQAIGNHLMAYSSYRPLERHDAHRLEAFINDHSSGVGSFLARMGRSVGSSMPVERPEPSREDHLSAVAAANAITQGEAAWLNQRAAAEGTFDELEQALARFIAEEKENGSTVRTTRAGYF